MAKIPNEATEPRVQLFFIGSYSERGMGNRKATGWRGALCLCQQKDNKCMKILKDLGWSLLGFLMLIVGIILIVALIAGGFKIAGIIYPYISLVSGIVFAICLLILLPLSIFKKTRLLASLGLFLSSYIFGLSTWIYGFLTALILWGLFAVIIGLFFAGIGVVPVAMLAAIFKGQWTIFFSLLFGIFLTFGSRMLALKLGDMVDEQKTKQIDAEYQEVSNE